MKIKDYSARFTFGIAIAGALITGGTLTAAPASAAGDELTVVNGGSEAMTICQSATSETTCGGVMTGLLAGENSRADKGWVDTDMIWLPTNCNLALDGAGPNYTGWGVVATAVSAGRWVKVSPNTIVPWEVTSTYRVTC